MSNLVKINAEEYGIDETKAAQIEAAFVPMLEKMRELEVEFNSIASKEITKETCNEAKALRLKYVKIRTATAQIHKESKAFYLAGSRFVDGWKNAQAFASEGIEKRLEGIEKHFENIEKERVAELYFQREIELRKYTEALPPGLGEMSEDVFSSYLEGQKLVFEAKKAAELKAEQERIENAKREAEERERTRLENERLRAEGIKLRQQEDARRVEAERAQNEIRRLNEEADRKEREQRAKEAEMLRVQQENDRKAADVEHKRKINNEALQSLIDLGTPNELAKSIIIAIASGKIKNVSIKY